MKIQFLGATETVTGSKYLLTIDEKKILIDCGLFQGYKELRLRNWDKLPFEPGSIDAVILTHAHIDHSGYIPLLVKNGFSGKIFCTHATKDLCEILLPDSGYLQEEEAYYANKHGYSKHSPALPLYTALDATQSLQHFQGCDFNYEYKIFDEFSFEFNFAGHILGASTVLIKSKNSSILFSGDLGRPQDPLMVPPPPPKQADYLVVESTYGNRKHSAINPADVLAEEINKTVARGGTVIIPAFAVGRAQSILYLLDHLKKTNQIANIPIFLDSPMAINATHIFCRYPALHRLTASQCQSVFGSVKYSSSLEESMQLDVNPVPKIIVSASGMATGGRVIHHIKAYAGHSQNSIIFSGYQAGGTRGDRMMKGERVVKMLGEMIRIKANVIQIDNLSAHADGDEILEWLKHFSNPVKRVFITHGETDAALTLKKNIEKSLGWNCVIPKYLDQEIL